MKYIKRPIPIEALQWTGSNIYEMLEFMTDSSPVFDEYHNLIISTLEGPMKAPPGSYIIKGIEGEFYPCRKDIFERSYTKVNEYLTTCEQCQKDFYAPATNIFYDELNKKYKYWAICPYCGIKNEREALYATI